MVTLPRLVIAAPASGAGKTAVATGLMAALARRGLRVSGHKAGPDYIDPGYHAVATGRPGRNLDPVLCGEGLMAPLLAHGASGAGIAVIEGVMGLFDGVASDGPWGSDPGFGSTAHLAALLGAPVVLVVDAAAAGRSVAALVAGFAGFDPRTRLAGVILNRVGSDRHEALLRKALATLPGPVPVLGAIRRHPDVQVPSRHLGLVPAAERQAAAARAVAALGDLIAASCDLAALVALARSAPPLATAPWDPAAALSTQADQVGQASQAGRASQTSQASLVDQADLSRPSRAGGAGRAYGSSRPSQPGRSSRSGRPGRDGGAFRACGPNRPSPTRPARPIRSAEPANPAEPTKSAKPGGKGFPGLPAGPAETGEMGSPGWAAGPAGGGAGGWARVHLRLHRAGGTAGCGRGGGRGFRPGR